MRHYADRHHYEAYWKRYTATQTYSIDQIILVDSGRSRWFNEKSVLRDLFYGFESEDWALWRSAKVPIFSNIKCNVTFVRLIDSDTGIERRSVYSSSVLG